MVTLKVVTLKEVKDVKVNGPSEFASPRPPQSKDVYRVPVSPLRSVVHALPCVWCRKPSFGRIVVDGRPAHLCCYYERRSNCSSCSASGSANRQQQERQDYQAKLAKKKSK